MGEVSLIVLVEYDSSSACGFSQFSEIFWQINGCTNIAHIHGAMIRHLLATRDMSHDYIVLAQHRLFLA